jgi:hypothetical protein
MGSGDLREGQSTHDGGSHVAEVASAALWEMLAVLPRPGFAGLCFGAVVPVLLPASAGALQVDTASFELVLDLRDRLAFGEFHVALDMELPRCRSSLQLRNQVADTFRVEPLVAEVRGVFSILKDVRK